MAFSRLQLAAALIEYDNDDPTAGPPRKASESAILAARARARPGAAALQAARGYQPSTSAGSRPGAEEQTGSDAEFRRSRVMGGSPRSPPDAGGEPPSSSFRDPRGSTRMSMAGPGYYQRQLQMLQAEDDVRRQQKRRSTAESSVGGAGAGLKEELREQDQGRQAARPADDNEVDISTWGLPESLVAVRAPAPASSSRGPPSTTAAGRRPQSHLRSGSSAVIDLASPAEEKDIGQVAFPQSHDVQPLSPGLERAIQRLPETEPHVDLSQHPSPPRDAAAAAAATIAGGRRRGHAGRTVSFSDWDAMAAAAGGGTEEEDRPLSRTSIMDRPRPRVSFDSAGPAPTLSRGGPGGRPVSFVALNDVDANRRPAHARAASEGGKINTASFGGGGRSPTSPLIHEEVLVEEDPETYEDDDGRSNPFALPAPSAGQRTSRFDAKAAEAQHRSSRRMSGSSSSALDYHEASTSRPLAGTRRDSRYSMRSQDMHPDEVRKSILRPKTLIMPAPLHGASAAGLTADADSTHLRGFQRGERPLPPGALTRPDSFVGTLEARTARASKLFTDSLPVDGKRGDHFIGGAANDGELKFQSFGETPAQQMEVLDEDGVATRAMRTDEDWRPNARTMKGLSLMDRIEARKAEMKGKQRVFTGDARPSMMSRSISQPALLAPEDAALHDGLALSPMSVDHRPLPGGSPTGSLLPIPSNGAISETTNALMGQRPGMPNTRSVFGVDQVWQRELDKLRAQEEHEKEMARKEEEEARRKREKKKKGKGKGKERALDQPAVIDEPSPEVYRSSMSLEPPSLAVSLPSEQEPQASVEAAALAPALDVDEWAAASDDEDDDDDDDDKKQRRPPRKSKPVTKDSDSSSEDDVPLSRAYAVKSMPPVDDESSDDEEPLSRLKAIRKDAPAANSRPAHDDDDEDNVPLGLRLQAQSMRGAEEEDDLPLGHRHQMAAQQQQQQRYSMFAQQQQQQQMMMGGFPSPFGPPPMGMPAFFGGPMPLPFNASMASLPHFGFPPGPGMAMGGPPPLDPAIDRWRREVVERDAMSTLSGSHGGPEESQRSRSVMS